MRSTNSTSSKGKSGRKAKHSKGSKRKHQIWSPDETRWLRQLLEEKTSLTRIQDLLKRSEKSIRRKCETLGISSATVYTISKGTESEVPSNPA
jgi:transcriptional regulator with PAS, ATPase and Fis domain